MKRKIYSLLMSLSVALMCAMPAIPVHADEITPTVIYSAVESGSVEITLNNAIYPVKSTSTRAWYCNGAVVTPDGVNIIDSSEGQTAKLKLATTTTANHMQNYAVIDTTTPTPAGEITPNQIARLYVISQANFNTATLSTRTLEAPIGDELYAKSITLYIDSTPYPNFQSLRFMIGGEVKDKITVVTGTNTYNLTDVITGRTTTIDIKGIEDSEAPDITSLQVTDGKADKYATQKTIKVVAKDNVGLPEDAYYWEDNSNLSTVIKEKIMSGEKASDIEGLAWGKSSTHDVTSNGIYSIFVRDKAGNIAYKDITVSKITNSAPMISSLTLGKDGSTVFIDVKASDSSNQPLQYKLNDGSWQDSNRLTNVKDGTNTAYVRNEAGVTVSATKEVFLDVYKNEVGDFSAKSLYNFIQVSPSTWTSKSVQVSLVLPDSLTPKLSSSPYSVNGNAFSSSRTYTVTENGATVQFTVKDIYGNTHSSEVYTVKNIDKDEPSIEVSADQNGSITVKAQDTGSGVSKIVVSSTNAANYMIKSNSGYGVTSDSASYKAPANGSYMFTVYDFAGNTAKASCTVNCYENTKSVQAGLKNSKTGTADRSGTTTGGKSGSSTLGTKASANERNGGTHASTNGSGEGGFLSFSTAGNSTRAELPDAETIEVVKTEESLTGAAPVMIEEATVDNTNNNKLKKLVFIMMPVLLLGVSAVVVILNIGKVRRK